MEIVCPDHSEGQWQKKKKKKVNDRASAIWLRARNTSAYAVNVHTAVFKMDNRDFPGGSGVKNPSANAGDAASILGLGRSHMPQSS